MRLHMHSLKSLVGKVVLSVVALGGFMVFAGAPALRTPRILRRLLARWCLLASRSVSPWLARPLRLLALLSRAARRFERSKDQRCRAKIKRGRKVQRPLLITGLGRSVRRYERRCGIRRRFVRRIGFRIRCSGRLIGKHRFEAARLTLIVQKHHGHHAHGLPARVALRYLALEILQKTVSKMRKRALAPGVLLVPGAAVRTDEFHLILLRIAVQSGPTRAPYANSFNGSALHRIYPLKFHVHRQ
jgi:hypothetical protein